MILLDPSHIKRRVTLVYSTYYLPTRGDFAAMLTNLYDESVGNIDTAKQYWTSTCVLGGTSQPEYYTYSGVAWGYSDNVDGNVGELSSRPVRHFDYTDNTTYPLRTQMSSGGWIFNIVDNGDGTYRHYEMAPTDNAVNVWTDSLAARPALPATVGSGLTNTNTIVAQAGHTTSAAQDCLNYT